MFLLFRSDVGVDVQLDLIVLDFPMLANKSWNSSSMWLGDPTALLMVILKMPKRSAVGQLKRCPLLLLAM